MITKYLVIDLQITEICDSYERAQEIAQSWAEASFANLRDADDDDIRRWASMPDCGLETGDIEIATVTWDDDEWQDLIDTHFGGKAPFGQVASGRYLRDAITESEIAVDGYEATLAEARKRGLIR